MESFDFMEMSGSKEKNIAENIKDEPLTEQSGKAEKRLTTTKKVLVAAWITFIGLIVLQVLGYDLGTATDIVGGCIVTIISSVYMWKSRTENKMRVSYEMIDKLADKYGIENIVTLLNNILSD